MTLEATPDMRRIVDELIECGRITETLADYARAQGYSDADIIASRERVRLSTARLEVQGHPARYRPAERPANPSDPTPERKKKAAGYMGSTTVGKGVYAPLKRYTLRSVIDMHADKFRDDHRTVFAAFVGDGEIHQRIRVADLNSSGGGGGQRLGGLGNAPQNIRDRHARFCWVSARLTRLEQQVCDVLVSHCITKRDGSPFTTEEFGALMYPMLSDRSFHRGAAVQGFMHLVDHLAELYHDPMCPRVRSKEQIAKLEAQG